MNIFFPFHLAMYLVFVDWPAVAQKLKGAKLFRRIVGMKEREQLPVKSDAV